MGCGASQEDTKDPKAREEKSSKPTLYFAPISAPCRAVLWLLQSNNLTDTVLLEEVDLAAGGTQTEAFTSKNKMQQVPALELPDGDVLTDSSVILMYLARVNALQKEVPEGDFVNIDVVQAFLQHGSKGRTVSNVISPVYARFRDPESGEPSDETIKAQVEERSADTKFAFDLIEQQLGKTKYAVTDEWTLADYLLAAEVTVWQTADRILPADLQLNTGNFPNTVRYIDAVALRNGFDLFVAPWKGAATVLRLVDAPPKAEGEQPADAGADDEKKQEEDGEKPPPPAEADDEKKPDPQAEEPKDEPAPPADQEEDDAQKSKKEQRADDREDRQEEREAEREERRAEKEEEREERREEREERREEREERREEREERREEREEQKSEEREE